MNEDSTIQPIIIILFPYKVMAIFKLERKQTAGFGEIYTFRLTMHIDRMSNHYGEWGAEITNFTMNLVCWLISLGFWYKDKLVESCKCILKLKKLGCQNYNSKTGMIPKDSYEVIDSYKHMIPIENYWKPLKSRPIDFDGIDKNRTLFIMFSGELEGLILFFLENEGIF